MIPKYQVGEIYKKGKKQFQIVRVQPRLNKYYLFEIIDGYLTKDEIILTEQEMSVMKKIPRDKGRVIGSLTKVEKGGHDLHLMELGTKKENYSQMYFTENQFNFIQNLLLEVEIFHILKRMIKDGEKNEKKISI